MRSSKRAADASHVALRITRWAAAFPVRVVVVAAAARVHRRHELEACRVAHAARRSGDGQDALLERLAQRVQCGPVELGQLIEEEHAMVGESGLAGNQVRAAADERRVRAGVMRRTKRPRTTQAAVTQQAGDALDDRDLERLVVVERRQEARDRSRQQGLARAGRTDEQQVVAACERDLERPAGVLLAADIGQVDRLDRRCKGRRRPDGPARLGPRP